MPTTPAAFIGHGSPMNTLEVNRYTSAWREFGATVERPRAVLCVSAHWYVNATAVTAMPAPRTIHDFYGFPDELFAVDYPAPGHPELAEEVAEVVKPHWVGQDQDSWGLDHGTWSVLTHVFPDADVPVVQLSINALAGFEHHLELGAALAPLRRKGVMVIASGNAVHNLRAIDWAQADGGYDWNRALDEHIHQVLRDDPGALPRVVEHPEFDRGHPSPDHFIPLLYLAGLAAASGEPAGTIVDGYSYGSLSMASYALGCATSPPHTDGDQTGGALPGAVPPQDTNI